MSELYDESKIIKLLMIKAVMLSPCGQVGLEAKIMSSSSSLSSKIWPRPWPHLCHHHVLELFIWAL